MGASRRCESAQVSVFGERQTACDLQDLPSPFNYQPLDLYVGCSLEIAIDVDASAPEDSCRRCGRLGWFLLFVQGRCALLKVASPAHDIFCDLVTCRCGDNLVYVPSQRSLGREVLGIPYLSGRPNQNGL